jgi:ABC-type molybdate transport system substrate-binding protein
LVAKGESVTKSIGVSAGASVCLCLCAGIGFAHPGARLPWPSELAISVIHNAPRQAAAAAWVEFIRTDSAAAVYQQYGFDYATAEERARREQK